MLLEVVGRCLEGIEDVANPNDAEHVVCDVFLVFDDALDVHLVDVHRLLVLDLLDDFLALDVELLLVDALLDDSLVLDAADVLHDLVYDDVLDSFGQLDVVLLFLSDDVDVLDVDLVLSILDGYDILDDDHLVDVSLGDLDVDVLVCLLVDALVDVLGLYALCRCQLACC